MADRELQPFHITLNKVGRFTTRDYETIYLGTSNPVKVQALWSAVNKTLEYDTKGCSYVPHMTLGQTARNSDAIAFLTDKGNKLLERHEFTWLVDSVALLRKWEDKDGRMELCAQISIGRHVEVAPRDHAIQGTPTYYYDDSSSWIPRSTNPPISPRTCLTVATYNILHDSDFPFPGRLPHILDVLLESDANVICLQEVTDESLDLILRDDRIRYRWPWSSRNPTFVMESQRNVVMFAEERFGFDWTRVELGGKHKACVVARLCCSESQLKRYIVIVGVHLTAGLTIQTLAKKREEVAVLLAYLRQHHADDEWVIVGDVNWPSDKDFPEADSMLDVWGEVIGEGGATYDPTRNFLAGATARFSRDPQRYDRAFLKKGGGLVVEPKGLSLFGNGMGSDHWGLRAVIHVRESTSSDVDARVKTHAISPSLRPLPTSFTEHDLRELCSRMGYFPSDTQDSTFQNAVDTLRAFLTDNKSISASSSSSATPQPSVIRLVVAPVGSFAMGYHTPHSDVDCIVVGNINPGTFWSLV